MVAVKPPNPTKHITAELWRQKKRTEQVLKTVQEDITALKTSVVKVK